MLSRFAERIVVAVSARSAPDPRGAPAGGRLALFGQVARAAPGRKARAAGRLAAALAALLGPGLGAAADCGGGRDLLAELAAQDPQAHAAIMAAASAEPNAEGVFWTVEASGVPTSWLMGSYHVPHPLVDPAPPGPTAALASARVMLMEMSPGEMSRLGQLVAEDPGLIANVERPPLDRTLPAEDFAVVAEAMQLMGVPPERTALMRPWIVQLTLATPPCAVPGLAGGTGTMDAGFAARAARQGLEVKGMETWDTLLPVLQMDEWSAESLDALVLAAREADEGRDMQTTSARLYRDEQVWPIWTYGIWRAERSGRDSGAEEMREWLFDARNRRFVEAALPEMERGGAFVLAGALHLGGEQGMVRLLRQAGFTVTRAPLR